MFGVLFVTLTLTGLLISSSGFRAISLQVRPLVVEGPRPLGARECRHPARAAKEKRERERERAQESSRELERARESAGISFGTFRLPSSIGSRLGRQKRASMSYASRHCNV